MQNYQFNIEKYKSDLASIVAAILSAKKFNLKTLDKILRKYPKDKNEIFGRDQVIAGINHFIKVGSVEGIKLSDNDISRLERIIDQIKLKPMRTVSGVTTVTVLTKPFACPGQCVFCPNDVRMPKSYIATEPGAQRALMNRFSPYAQVFNRLQALKNIGHPTQKIELLILGGTWSYYPKKYKIWFIHECFRAMNEFSRLHGNDNVFHQNMSDLEDLKGINIENDLKNDINTDLRKIYGNKPYNQLIQTKEFKEAFKAKIIEEKDIEWDDLIDIQDKNSKSSCRCVGLVLETRPDTITPTEVLDLRKLGATKIQLGIQTLDDTISDLNKRGEHRAETSRAFQLLRAGGFKIHAHIMPNLYGATPEIDLKVYKELFESEQYKPDELKIYPTSIIKNTELYNYWQEGKYKPYTTQQLINLIADCIEATPQYCRLTRIIRDIPSTEIADGNKTTNLREVIEYKLAKEGRKNQNIRAREVKSKNLKFEDLKLDIVSYSTEMANELFLQFITAKNEIAGFLRLSLPKSKDNIITDELDGCAIIREVHVYGPSLEFDKTSSGQAQHLGLGTQLIQKAKEITKEKGFTKLAVISSIGTREYYDKRGFKLNEYYQIAEL
jgi:elongator complex protein 3